MTDIVTEQRGPSIAQHHGGGRLVTRWVVTVGVALLLVVAVTAGGFAVGRSGGASVSKARASATRLGAAEGALAGSRAGFRSTYGRAYRVAYHGAYAAAYRRSFMAATR